MHRLFIAIDLPEDIRSAVARLCRGVTDARWVKPEQIHLTLRFIGDTDDLLFLRIREGLSQVTNPSLCLSLGGIGTFPGGGQPRVLWAGVERDESLWTLRDRIEEALVAAGCEPEARRFSPHITLARLRDVPRSRVTPYLSEHGRFFAGPFSVTEFHLYSSVLGRDGSRHTVESSYPLGPAASPPSPQT